MACLVVLTFGIVSIMSGICQCGQCLWVLSWVSAEKKQGPQTLRKVYSYFQVREEEIGPLLRY